MNRRSSFRKSQHRRRWNSRKARGQLSDRELRTEETREYINLVKTTIQELKETHRDYEEDKKKDQVERRYHEQIQTLVQGVRKIAELEGISEDNHKSTINELSQKVNNLEYQLAEKKEKLTDTCTKELKKEITKLAHENEDLKSKLGQQFIRNEGRQPIRRTSRSGSQRNSANDNSSSQAQNESILSSTYSTLEASPGSKRRRTNEPFEKETIETQLRSTTDIEKLENDIKLLEKEKEKILCRERDCQKNLDKLNETLTKEKTEKELALQRERECQMKIESVNRLLAEEKKAKDSALQKERECHMKIESMNKLLAEEKKAKESALQKEREGHKKIDRLNELLTEERKAKESALQRLSAVAGSMMRDNNPGITDLSDPNRPLKLTEKIDEIYDSTWTSAMDKLEENGVDEQEGAKLLYSLIEEIYNYCQLCTREQLELIENLKYYVGIPGAEKPYDKEKNIKALPAEIIKPLKDFRKEMAAVAIPGLKKAMNAKLLEKFQELEIECCVEYIDSLVENVWRMCVQDPPMVFDFSIKHGDDFKSDAIRPFTERGEKIKFMVWPPLLLHADGPRLSKGVAQGCKQFGS